MYACVYVRCTYVNKYACVYAGMNLCMYACMYTCHHLRIQKMPTQIRQTQNGTTYIFENVQPVSARPGAHVVEALAAQGATTRRPWPRALKWHPGFLSLTIRKKEKKLDRGHWFEVSSDWMF